MTAPDTGIVRWIAVLVAVLAACGCAALDPVRSARSVAESPVHECLEWYAALDAAVDGAGVRDARDARVEGFPGSMRWRTLC